MFDVENTLLPKTSTPLAKAMDILEERLFDLPVQMISKDPAVVDAALLDHLAWENSVDVWDSQWPEDVRRNLIARSEELHQTKGTPDGIKLALSLCGASAELEEWWHEGVNGPRGTFQVKAYVTRSLYENEAYLADPNTHQMLIQVVERVAPVSRGFTFLLGVRGAADVFAGAGVRLVSRHVSSVVPVMKSIGQKTDLAGSSFRIKARRRAVFEPVMNIFGDDHLTASAAVRVSSRTVKRGIS